MREELSSNIIETFLEKTGKRGAALLSALGKQSVFIQAIETELGKQLLQDVLSVMEAKLEKIIAEEATEVDRADYRALRRISLAWAERIVAYNNNLKKISG